MTTEKRRLPGGNREHNTTEHPKGQFDSLN